MLYLIGDPNHPITKYFFVNPTIKVAASQWAYDMPIAIRHYKEAAACGSGKTHSVLSWIASGCANNHMGYYLIAIYESDDLEQDFESLIPNFRENHPEYFL